MCDQKILASAEYLSYIMDLTCSACGHEFSYKTADLILATSDDTTTHEVRQRAVCRGCGVRRDKHVSGSLVGCVLRASEILLPTIEPYWRSHQHTFLGKPT